MTSLSPRLCPESEMRNARIRRADGNQPSMNTCRTAVGRASSEPWVCRYLDASFSNTKRPEHIIPCGDCGPGVRAQGVAGAERDRRSSSALRSSRREERLRRTPGRGLEVVGVVPAGCRRGFLTDIRCHSFICRSVNQYPGTVFIVAHHSITQQEACLLRRCRVSRTMQTDSGSSAAELAHLDGTGPSEPTALVGRGMDESFFVAWRPGGLPVACRHHGANAYSVAPARREVGIPIALGASRGDVLRLVFTAGGGA